MHLVDVGRSDLRLHSADGPFLKQMVHVSTAYGPIPRVSGRHRNRALAALPHGPRVRASVVRCASQCIQGPSQRTAEAISDIRGQFVMFLPDIALRGAGGVTLLP